LIIRSIHPKAQTGRPDPGATLVRVACDSALRVWVSWLTESPVGGDRGGGGSAGEACPGPITFGPIVAGLALIVLFAWHSLRVARPLIELRLFGFRAAAATTFLLGGALFGTLLVLPLYYQVDRGESALNAGLLLARRASGPRSCCRSAVG
jgi:hypothetical protein